jgi:hypothetical protein
MCILRDSGLVLLKMTQFSPCFRSEPLNIADQTVLINSIIIYWLTLTKYIGLAFGIPPF